MFKLSIKSLLFIIFIVLAGSCSPKIGKYDSLLNGINAKPEVLALHRDSVRFRIEGAIPLELLNKDTKITLFPEYIYGEGALRLGEIVPYDGAFTKSLVAAKVDEQYIFPYLPGMDQGTLIMKGLVERRNNVFQSPTKVLAEGLETSPLLTRIGQIIQDQPIPDIGIYLEKFFSESNTLETREFTVAFQPGNAERMAPVLPLPIRDFLLLGESGKKIDRIIVTGLISPDSRDNIQGLAQKRAEFISEYLKENRGLKGIEIETEYRSNDWFDLRLLLSDYEGIKQTEKEEVYTILLNESDYFSQKGELQRLPAFRKISRDLFPKLSSAKISLVLEDTRFNDIEIAASVYALLQEEKPLAGFNQDHLIFAGQTAKKLDEKEAIFFKLTEMYPSELAFNNLGVVYLNQAQRELDLRAKNVLITKSMNMFRQANRIKTTSVSLHNIGRAYLLRGDYFDAYISISEASALEKNETDAFLIYNEGIRGALDIINGDYKLATIRLNRATENEENLFNKGLAYFLSEDYRLALESFEECVQINRESGYGFYGLALVASYSEDIEALKENLSKAVERSEFLKEKAFRDINFKPFIGTKELIEIFR
ncbi:tetratricopeptide repeat protein [Aquiflexum lacus]|uniref:tetratricopeptide repeat protein n=1 Tax=Aquiflexum lacus TaxID=2483805 RepID=UPI001894EEC3|nr:tetratricopeptide repeat protein [Aquiflexum lacus]